MTYRITTVSELKSIEQFRRSLPTFQEMVRPKGHHLFKSVDVDIEKLYKWVIASEHNSSTFTRLVMNDEGTVFGGIAGSLDTYIYSSELRAFERLFYLDPRVKDRTLVIKLLDAFVRWAIEAGALDVIIGNSTGINLVGFDKLAKHLGFDPATIGYIRRLQ